MNEFEQSEGYVPGVIGRVVQLHADYYANAWGFGQYFETKVATELVDFLSNYNPAKDLIISLSINGEIEGSVSIDGTSEKQNIAHLRWFIMSDKLRGKGAGNVLMTQSIEFCQQCGYDAMYLWTFKGLSSARHLYEKYGFLQTEEKEGEQWGIAVTEQRFDLQFNTNCYD